MREARRQQAIISKWSQYVSNITASWEAVIMWLQGGEGEKLSNQHWMKTHWQNKKLKCYDFHFVQFPTNKLVVLSNYQSYRFTRGWFFYSTTNRKLRVLGRIEWCLLIMNLAEWRWDILNTDILHLVVIISLADCKMTYYCLTNQTERKYQLQSLIYEENFNRNLWRVPPR